MDTMDARATSLSKVATVATSTGETSRNDASERPKGLCVIVCRPRHAINLDVEGTRPFGHAYEDACRRISRKVPGINLVHRLEVDGGGAVDLTFGYMPQRRTCGFQASFHLFKDEFRLPRDRLCVNLARNRIEGWKARNEDEVTEPDDGSDRYSTPFQERGQGLHTDDFWAHRSSFGYARGRTLVCVPFKPSNDVMLRRVPN
jgi:hypothetical protein